MLTTPFVIHDENSQAVKSISKPSQKGLSFASVSSNSPKKLSIRNGNITTIKPRKALGSITSNDLNVRITNKNANGSAPSTNSFSKSATINILSENPTQPFNKYTSQDSVSKPSNKSKEVAHINSDLDFHPDDMKCTRKPGKSFATMDPYDYYIEKSNTKSSTQVATFPVSDEELSTLMKQAYQKELNDLTDVIVLQESTFSPLHTKHPEEYDFEHEPFSLHDLHDVPFTVPLLDSPLESTISSAECNPANNNIETNI